MMKKTIMEDMTTLMADVLANFLNGSKVFEMEMGIFKERLEKSFTETLEEDNNISYIVEILQRTTMGETKPRELVDILHVKGSCPICLQKEYQYVHPLHLTTKKSKQSMLVANWLRRVEVRGLREEVQCFVWWLHWLELRGFSSVGRKDREGGLVGRKMGTEAVGIHGGLGCGLEEGSDYSLTE
uniref:Uncharacterized protein n=1 Tax=Chenopodium quinoa TaxID=63459 RepID=A0A803LIU4_CHEQI